MFHKTDAQVKNIFHSVGRSKNGLHKCSLLYHYANSVKGCADSPEARRAALHQARLACQGVRTALATGQSSPRLGPTADPAEEELPRLGAWASNVSLQSEGLESVSFSDGSAGDAGPGLLALTAGSDMVEDPETESGDNATSGSASPPVKEASSDPSLEIGSAGAAGHAATLDRPCDGGLACSGLSPMELPCVATTEAGAAATRTDTNLSAPGNCSFDGTSPFFTDPTAATQYTPSRDPLLLLRALTGRGQSAAQLPPGLEPVPQATSAAALPVDASLPPQRAPSLASVAAAREVQVRPPGSPQRAPGFQSTLYGDADGASVWDVDDMSPFVAVAGLAAYHASEGGAGGGWAQSVAGGQLGNRRDEPWNTRGLYLSACDYNGAVGAHREGPPMWLSEPQPREPRQILPQQQSQQPRGANRCEVAAAAGVRGLWGSGACGMNTMVESGTAARSSTAVTAGCGAGDGVGDRMEACLKREAISVAVASGCEYEAAFSLNRAGPARAPDRHGSAVPYQMYQGFLDLPMYEGGPSTGMVTDIPAFLSSRHSAPPGLGPGQPASSAATITYDPNAASTAPGPLGTPCFWQIPQSQTLPQACPTITTAATSDMQPVTGSFGTCWGMAAAAVFAAADPSPAVFGAPDCLQPRQQQQYMGAGQSWGSAPACSAAEPAWQPIWQQPCVLQPAGGVGRHSTPAAFMTALGQAAAAPAAPQYSYLSSCGALQPVLPMPQPGRAEMPGHGPALSEVAAWQPLQGFASLEQGGWSLPQ